MNFKNQNHAKYLSMAEEMYHGADGDFFAANDQDSYGADINYGADGQGNGDAMILPDFDRSFSVRLVNTVAVDTTVTIFGANQFANAVNFGLPATVTVTVPNSTYAELLAQSQTQPFDTAGFRIRSANTDAILQELTVVKRNAQGVRAQYIIDPDDFFSEFQNQATRVTIAPYRISISGETQISFSLLASATVTFTFFMGKVINQGNMLSGKPMTAVAPAPIPINKQNLTISPGAVNALAGAIASRG